MLNLFQHLINPVSYETLNQVQGDKTNATQSLGKGVQGRFDTSMKVFSFCKKILLLTVFLPSIILLSSASYGLAEKSTLSLNLKDSMIELKAEKVPLLDILKAISDRTGISMTLDNSMIELISIDFKVPIEECLQRLLKNKNYAMIYNDGTDGQRGLAEIYVISSRTKVKYGGKSGSPEDSIIRDKQDWFKREFGEGRALLHLISATPSRGGSDGEGVEITMVPGNSPFHKIGLEEGDVVVDVNGTRVNTVQGFIQALQDAPKERPNVRIDRRRSDGRIDPIYIDVK